MNNYKKMFDEINISDDCLRKVKNMEAKNKKIKKFKLRYATIAIIVLALFATSNVVSYAATGSGITKNIKSILTDKNGNKTELNESGKGKYNYRDDDEKVEIQLNEDTAEKESISVNTNIDKSKNEINMEIRGSEK